MKVIEVPGNSTAVSARARSARAAAVHVLIFGSLSIGLCAGGLGCTDRGLIAVNDAGATGGTGAGTDGGGWQVFPAPSGRKVDVLFMVDNSPSMAPLQAKLNASFAAFVDTLQALPDGPPDMHIAVISSDTGPGKYDLPSFGCQFGGDAGRFRFLPRGACTTSPLLPGQTFLQVKNGVPSYTTDLVTAFNCISALGDQGCGFEGQLKSVRLALDPAHVPDGNAGFLRPEALLAVVLITNEDDCSLPDDSDLADPVQTLMSSPLGPLWSFRCNEFGHLCNINGALRPPPRGAADNLLGCVSNDTATGKLTKVAAEVSFLKSLKANPDQILVAAITGPATPYGIEMIQQGSDPEMHPSIKHSCTLSTGEYADPAVRIQQWVNAFGAHGMMLPICADSMAPQLGTIATQIGRSSGGAMCVNGPFPYSSGGTQPDCRVADRRVGVNGGFDEQLIPNCVDTGDVPPCWRVLDDPSCPDSAKLLSIDRGATPASDFGTEFTCAPCPTDRVEIGCPLNPHQSPDAAPLP